MTVVKQLGPVVLVWFLVHTPWTISFYEVRDLACVSIAQHPEISAELLPGFGSQDFPPSIGF